MKSLRSAYLRSIAVLFMFSAAAWMGHAQAVVSDDAVSDPYTMAVSSYIKAAQNELSAFELQIKAGENAGNQQKFASARAALGECRGVLKELSDADPKKFDVVKARYEQSRADLRKKIAAAQQP